MQFGRYVLQVFGVALLLSGSLWMLQGFGLIDWPANSFMLGETQWALIGTAVAGLGAFLVYLAEKRR